MHQAAVASLQKLRALNEAARRRRFQPASGYMPVTGLHMGHHWAWHVSQRNGGCIRPAGWRGGILPPPAKQRRNGNLVVAALLLHSQGGDGFLRVIY